LSATPIDLTRVLKLEKPVVRVRYELEEMAGDAAGKGQSNLTELLAPIVERARAGKTSGARH
jgi:predicted GTPase